MGKYWIHKAKIFGLTWRLEPEGSLEEETRKRSGSTVFFFGGGDDFRRSSSAASPMFFSCESAVCSRLESWGRNWNRSRSPKLAKVSSVEDLKYAMQSKRDKVVQERSSKAKSYDVSRPKFGRAFFPARGGGRTSRGLAGIAAPSSSPEDGRPEVWQESLRHHHLRPGRHLCASSKHVMSWVRRILILLELRRNRVRDTLHLRVGADSIGLH
jgi:hypothetical protein